MKKYLIGILFLATFLLNAQITVTENQGFYWSDSLWNDIYVDTSATPDDTIAVNTTSEYDVNFMYEWITITINDTGSTITDSLYLEGANYVLAADTNSRNVKYMKGDAVWLKIPFLRDSTWTNVDVMAKANRYHSYTAHIGGFESIRVRLGNVTATENRISKFMAVLSRKK